LEINMSKASEHYQAGELKQAIAAAIEDVKKNPTDTARRSLLCDLLLFNCDIEKADKQLDAIGHQDPDAAVGIGLYRHLLRAEEARQQFYNDGRVPEFIGLPSDHLKLHLEASIRLREGNVAEAMSLLAKAEEKRPHCKGTCGGKAFDDFRDGDDLNASYFEVLTSTGKYFWIGIDQVEYLEIRKPTRPRDLVWVRAHMIVKDGPDGEVYMPTMYAGTHTNEDDRVRLGRSTDWKGKTGEPVRGVGQRTFLVGEEGKTILELGTVNFEQPGV